LKSVHRIMVAFVVVASAACGPDDAPSTPVAPLRPTAAQMRDATREIGDYHTQVMQHAFLALQAERQKAGGQRLSGRQICDVFDVSLKKFMYKGKLHSGNDLLRSEALRLGRCDSATPFLPDRALQPAVFGTPRSPLADIITQAEITESGLSPAGQSLLTQLMDVTNSPNDDYDGYIAAVSSIENAAANTLGQEEVELIFQMSSLARESAWYWNGNVVSWWVTLGGNPANCLGDACVYVAYSTDTDLHDGIEIPTGGFRPQSVGFPGPICIYSCSPSGRKIAGLIFGTDVTIGARATLEGFMTRRLRGTAIDWAIIGIKASSASIVAAGAAATVSWAM
jgi:hypothetical protein